MYNYIKGFDVMVKIKIERYNDQLEGIGYVDNKIIFVPKTMIGDTVDVDITYESKNFLRGKLKTDNTRKVDCPFFYNCGGCDLRFLPYDETISLKKDNLKKLLDKNKIVYSNINVIKNKNYFNYRNKISLKIVDGIIGFYEDKSNIITKIDNCLIAKDEINRLIKIIPSFNILNGFITIRCNYNNELLIIIDTKDKVSYDFEMLKRDFKIAGVVVNNKTVLNDNFFFDKINSTLFKVSFNSFFQVNNYCAGKIFDIIENNINSSDDVLDLYSGVGTLSITAAKKPRNVIGIEVIKNAVLNSLVNKDINKLKNVEFILGDVPKVLSKLNNCFNTFIFDPPRAGLDKFTINYTLNRKPDKIIYVSCNPVTLVRDLSYLQGAYIITNINLIDMFSYTHHYECVVILKLK